MQPINAMHDSHSQQDALTWFWTIAEGMVDQIDDVDTFIGYSAEGG